MKSLDADPQEDRPGQGQKQELGPQDRYPHPLEKDPPDDDEEVGKGIRVSDPPHQERDVVDREDEPGEQHRGHKVEEDRHEGLLLGPGDGGDEDADAEGVDQIEDGGEGQEEDVPPKRDPKPEGPDQEDQDEIDETHAEERKCLANDQVYRLEGGE